MHPMYLIKYDISYVNMHDFFACIGAKRSQAKHAGGVYGFHLIPLGFVCYINRRAFWVLGTIV